MVDVVVVVLHFFFRFLLLGNMKVNKETMAAKDTKDAKAAGKPKDFIKFMPQHMLLLNFMVEYILQHWATPTSLTCCVFTVYVQLIFWVASSSCEQPPSSQLARRLPRINQKNNKKRERDGGGGRGRGRNLVKVLLLRSITMQNFDSKITAWQTCECFIILLPNELLASTHSTVNNWN